MVLVKCFLNNIFKLKNVDGENVDGCAEVKYEYSLKKDKHFAVLRLDTMHYNRNLFSFHLILFFAREQYVVQTSEV